MRQSVRQPSVSLLDLRPELLADTVDPVDAELAIKAAIAAGSPLTAMQRQALNYALGYWVMQVIERPSDLESVLLLDRVCALAARAATLAGATAPSDDAAPSATPSDFCSRLSALREMLENKRQAIVVRNSQQRPLQADAIIGALAAGSQTQAALAKQLHLSAGRISQLLALMESLGMVQRQRCGRENQVRLLQIPSGAEKQVSARPDMSPSPRPQIRAPNPRPTAAVFGRADLAFAA